MKLIHSMVFLLLLAGCSPAKSTEPPRLYSVQISAGENRLAVGETTTVKGAVNGGFGNPRYYITLTDQIPSGSKLSITLLPGNQIARSDGASAVLEVLSTKLAAGTVTVGLRAKAKGSTGVVIGVNGEIGEMDSSGKWFFNYIARYSDSLTVTVN